MELNKIEQETLLNAADAYYNLGYYLKNFEFESVAEFSDKNFFRNCWQHGRDRLEPICSDTQFQKILCTTREVINF